MPPSPMLNIAVRAARAAGTVITRAAQRVDTLTIQTKTRHDYVSEVDYAAEHAIVQTLRKAFPDHAILAEEGGATGQSDYTWIIDPLDGTTNFLHGVPQCAVSIALRYKEKLQQAVVYDPFRDELFTATRGAGASLNNRRLRVTNTKNLEDALLGTGFPFKQMDYLDTYLNMFRALVPQVAGIRRAGSAALDLAWVACGRYDGFWEMNLNPWDIAAGALLIEEAGGIVSDFAGKQDYLVSGNVVSGNPKLHEALLKTITPFL